MADEDLPYRAEYSKSGRASCRGCKGNIAKDVLRLAVMVQSPMFDGKVPHWYHHMCFFGKQRPASVGDIAHFESLRYEDQQKLKSKIENAGNTPVATKGKSKAAVASAENKKTFKDFSVEAAKSGKATCKGCEVKIIKDEIRISKLDYNSEKAKRFGPMPRWHHIECFVKLRDELEFYGGAADLPGFHGIGVDKQKELKELIKPIKRKAEDEVDSAPPEKKVKAEDEALAKKQNDAMFKFRDKLKNLPKKDLAYLIEHNVDDFDGTGGESRLLDWLSDIMTFGVPESCPGCGNPHVRFQSGKGYVCQGFISEYTRCTTVSKAPKRIKFKVPPELAEEYGFLKTYKQPNLGDRFFMEYVPTAKQAHTGPKTEAPNRHLAGLSFVVAPAKYESGKKPAELKTIIKKMGGDVITSVTETTAAVISTKEAVSKFGKLVKEAQALGVQCVGEEFLEEVKAGGGALLLIKKKAISDWGGDPEKRVKKTAAYKSAQNSLASKKEKAFEKESMYTKSIPEKLKLKLKAGGAVDPDSGLSDSAHVLTYGNKLYNCVLGYVDVTKGTNSYYKIQVLESDSMNAWWVFRSWGRIGTTIGGTKLEDMADKQDAIQEFHSLFEDRTGNSFKAAEFIKVPGKYTVMELDYDNQEEITKLSLKESKSKLHKSVQELISLIFDVDTMKSQMVEFEIDLKKLPLGKLSKRQLNKAYAVLTEAQNILNTDSKDNANQILDCSNRFYSLIPHDFGMERVPLLDNLELIKTKIDMIESLTEIEIAYNLLKSNDDIKDGESDDPFDIHYRKLKTKIEPVDKDSEEFQLLEKYVKNTHAATHCQYRLKIEEAFKIERSGEAKRFKPFKKLHNHKLLWHGSRLTNFAGILSQGLRIAPPEAPATGYMFGKGIYFADMVSKSANYCNTNPNSSTGLMLLCDVALGNMYERTNAEYVTKLSGGKHSTKGCGRTCPDPKDSVQLDGVEVPVGKGIADERYKKSSLLYNEYIVYDVAQVQAKYLLRMNFGYSTINFR